jgi:hypothetical protein
VTGVDPIPNGGPGHGDEQGRPPGHARDIGVDRAMGWV